MNPSEGLKVGVSGQDRILINRSLLIKMPAKGPATVQNELCGL